MSFETTDLGGGVFRYEFTPHNLTLLKNQEFDIKFSPTLFANLFNGAANDEFRLILLQPNNPGGVSGDYSALALIDHPSMAGPFTVDVTWLGDGAPGALPLVIHQFDSTGQHITGTISATPEPASWLLSGVGSLLVGYWLRAARRRS